MSEAYWRYAGGDGRLPAGYQAVSTVPVKRPRSDFSDAGNGPEYAGYVARDEDRVTRYVVRDNDTIGASYDHYLRNSQISSFGPGDNGRSLSGLLTSHHVEDPRVASLGSMDNRNSAIGGRRSPTLPPDASNTLFVEGLPANCSRREASHIFRPFVGFREVRLVNKESRNAGGDPLLLCFVDFSTPSQATVALDALQGYKFDEHDRESAYLRLQFARFAGPRSGGGPRGRR